MAGNPGASGEDDWTEPGMVEILYAGANSGASLPRAKGVQGRANWAGEGRGRGAETA